MKISGVRQCLALAALLTTGAPVGVRAGAPDGSHKLPEGCFDDQKVSHEFKAHLRAFEETPAIISLGRGKFRLKIAPDGSSIDYELSYSDLDAPATVAHIHVGQRGVAGGVAAFLCGGGGKPDCPAAGGTVTGTIKADDVIGPDKQDVMPGDLGRLLIAIRAGLTYANVHTELHPEGEIRGQIEPRRAFDCVDDG